MLEYELLQQSQSPQNGKASSRDSEFCWEHNCARHHGECCRDNLPDEDRKIFSFLFPCNFETAIMICLYRKLIGYLPTDLEIQTFEACCPVTK